MDKKIAKETLEEEIKAFLQFQKDEENEEYWLNSTQHKDVEWLISEYGEFLEEEDRLEILNKYGRK